MRWIIFSLVLTSTGILLGFYSGNNLLRTQDHSTSQHSAVDADRHATMLRVLEYTSAQPRGCELIQTTSGKGKNQADAKSVVIQHALSAGGNALVFYRGNVSLDSRTNRAIKYTFHAKVYRCVQS